METRQRTSTRRNRQLRTRRTSRPRGRRYHAPDRRRALPRPNPDRPRPNPPGKQPARRSRGYRRRSHRRSHAQAGASTRWPRPLRTRLKHAADAVPKDRRSAETRSGWANNGNTGSWTTTTAAGCSSLHLDGTCHDAGPEALMGLVRSDLGQDPRHRRDRHPGPWVPETQFDRHYAAFLYSWMSPPSTSRRRMRSRVRMVAESRRVSLTGGCCWRERCGRCVL
jgi:hypothetical protein